MKKTLLVILFLQIFAFSYSQGIIVNGTGMPESNYGSEQLLTDVLLDGGICSAIDNFQLKDNPSELFPSVDRSWGFFDRGNSNFPFQRGVVLTTGFSTAVEGPDDGIQSDGGTNWTGDAQATILADAATSNATVFEFDFIPQGNEISFNYIFASEEYPEYSCNATYNDVFAFIISGPGITNDPGLNGKNIALLPNGDPVTINNVNDQSCGDDTYYVAGPFGDIEHGGRTTPLVAYSQVVPGETYHIRLLIADAGDESYDSAVFLEAGSFNLGSTIVDEEGIDLGESLMVCGQEQYTLHVNVDDPTVQLQWYVNDQPIPGATTNQLVISESGEYKIEVINGDCSATDQIDVMFGDVETNNTSFVIQLTDQEDDGIENFNLTAIEPQIIENADQYTFTYYEDLQDAQDGNNNFIQTPTSYPASHGDVVYVRVENEAGCHSVVTLNLRLSVDENPCDFIPICSNDDINEDVIPLEDEILLNASCVSFSNTEIAFYYLRIEEGTTFTFTITPDTDNDYDFMVWQNAEDCTDLTNIMATRASYDAPDGSYETGLMLNETDLCETAAGGGDVEGFVKHLDVQPGDEIIIAIYKFNPGGGFNLSFGGDSVLDCTILGELDYAQCDDDNDGQVQFDLNPIAEEILEGDDFLNVTFYSTEEDATNDTGQNIVSSPYTVTTSTSPDVIYGQVKDDLGEVLEIFTITFSISDAVTGAQNFSEYFCDAGLDGVETVDLTSFNVIANPADYTIRYYESEQDAIDGNATFIPSPASYETGTATIYVRIENANGCFTIAEINIEVSGLEVDLGEDFSMCTGSFILTAAGDFSEFNGVTFEWTRNGTIIEGATSNTLEITQIGQYMVTVNTSEGCTGTDTVNVTQGEEPTITSVTVGPDSVIIEATGGVTPYQYSITGVVWQDSNQFNYLQPGNYTIYVRTAEGCIVSQEFVIFRIPTMFTPNGDGINDTWRIQGFEIYQGSNIVIYDRQGRLVYQSQITSSEMWNGFFANGQKAPTQDYWYIINVSDGRKFTGHITVKSRGEQE